jgi:methionine biosynthesis protein MetW
MEFSDLIRDFEEARWRTRDQEPGWRHETALRLVQEEPVLDVGGGDGAFLAMLRAEKGFARHALVDISPAAVEKARKKGLEAVCCDISKGLPFPDGAFATACAIDVLEHLFDPLPLLKEMGRVARKVVIVVPNFNFAVDRWRMLLGRIPSQCKPKRGHVYWFNYSIFQTMIHEAGLHPEEVILGTPRRLGKLGSLLAAGFPNLFAHSFAARLDARCP